jgi:hypothetical protein
MLILRLFKFIVFFSFLGASLSFIFNTLYAPRYQGEINLFIGSRLNSDQELKANLKGIEDLMESEYFLEALQEKSASQTLKKFDQTYWNQIVEIKNREEKNIFTLKVFSNNPQIISLVLDELDKYLTDILRDLTGDQAIELRIINGPYETYFDLLNLLNPVLMGAYLGAGVALVIFIVFDKRADSWLYKKDKYESLLDERSPKEFSESSYLKSAKPTFDKTQQQEDRLKETSQSDFFKKNFPKKDQTEPKAKDLTKRPKTGTLYSDQAESPKRANQTKPVPNKLLFNQTYKDFDEKKFQEDEERMKERLNRLINE